MCNWCETLNQSTLKIASFVKSQNSLNVPCEEKKQIQLGTKAVIEWQLNEKRLRGRPKKRQMDGIRQNLEGLEVID